ncbi:hypothetical protein ABTC24_19380, partial [Acinetobacter baumannii]
DTSSSFINLLKTPYGSTSFVTYTYSDGHGETVVVLKFLFPDQTSSVVRLQYGLYYQDTDYWDREAMMLHPLDYTVTGLPYYSDQTL